MHTLKGIAVTCTMLNIGFKHCLNFKATDLFRLWPSTGQEHKMVVFMLSRSSFSKLSR
jgi:hypothetical protein